MKAVFPQTIYLKDYAAPAYLVDDVQLTFRLHPTQTRVLSRVAFRPNPDSDQQNFMLNGENMRLISAKIDGKECAPKIENGRLTVDVPDAAFIWEAEVEISPETNTALEGLYMSGGMYCTSAKPRAFARLPFIQTAPMLWLALPYGLKASCRSFCPMAIQVHRANAGSNGTILGQNPHISLRLSQAILLITPINLPHNRAKMLI